MNRPIQQKENYHCGLFSLANAWNFKGSVDETSVVQQHYQIFEKALNKSLGQWETITPEMMSKVVDFINSSKPNPFEYKLKIRPLFKDSLPKGLTQFLDEVNTAQMSGHVILTAIREPDIPLHWTLIKSVNAKEVTLFDSGPRVTPYDRETLSLVEEKRAENIDPEGLNFFPHCTYQLDFKD